MATTQSLSVAKEMPLPAVPKPGDTNVSMQSVHSALSEVVVPQNVTNVPDLIQPPPPSEKVETRGRSKGKKLSEAQRIQFATKCRATRLKNVMSRKTDKMAANDEMVKGIARNKTLVDKILYERSLIEQSQPEVMPIQNGQHSTPKPVHTDVGDETPVETHDTTVVDSIVESVIKPVANLSIEQPAPKQQKKSVISSAQAAIEAFNTYQPLKLLYSNRRRF